MDKISDKTRLRFIITILFVCALSGLAIGYFGLQQHNQLLTWFSAGLFITGIVVFFVGMVYPFEWNQFWFSYVLQRLGRIGWTRRFGIGQHAEGAIDLAIINQAWGAYINIIVGAGSYVFNDLTTIAFGLFAGSWLLLSTHLLFQKLRNLGALVEIINVDQRVMFKEKIERTTNWFNKYSIVFMVLGAIVANVLITFWIDWRQDRALDRLSFYVTTPWTQLPKFAMVYPSTTVSYFFGRFSLGLFYGFLAVVGGLVIATTILLLWLTSGEIRPVINIYDADCLKPAEELLNSFWLMTGAGLLLVPFATTLSINLMESGQSAAASRWLNYMSWTYIIFFVGFFFFSLIKFYSFVSMAKKPIEKQLREELKNAMEQGVDRDKLEASRIKLQLLHDFKSRPTTTTIVQLAEIISIILLNFAIKFLG